MSDENRDFWGNFLRAVETEPRPVPHIVGASGIEHSLLALGVDDVRKRLVLISGDHDARASAMMQTDVQSTMPGTHVVVARPIAIGLPTIAQRIIEITGTSKISMSIFQNASTQEEMQAYLGTLLNRVLPSEVIFKLFNMVPLDILSQILFVIRQLTYIDVQMAVTDTGGQQLQHLDLTSLATRDLMKPDRDAGVCPLPLYMFTDEDWGAFQSRSRDDLAEHLKALGVYQYFFPAPDHAVLGLIDRTSLVKTDVAPAVQRFVEMGHPIGEPELVRPAPTMLQMIDDLQDKGLVIEGKVNFTLTDEGSKIRGSVAFKPRESAISKLVNQLRLSINIKNYFT
jgi:hypothetical protein